VVFKIGEWNLSGLRIKLLCVSKEEVYHMLRKEEMLHILYELMGTNNLKRACSCGAAHELAAMMHTVSARLLDVQSVMPEADRHSEKKKTVPS